MSFDNVIGGKLSLKGGALPVVGGVKKKKKKAKTNELARRQLRLAGRVVSNGADCAAVADIPRATPVGSVWTF